MARRKTPGGTPAVAALQSAEVAHTLHPYETASGGWGPGAQYGLEAASALGLDPAVIFKTLVVEAGDRHAVAVVPVACILDLRAFAAALGAKKAVLAGAAVAERITGYVVGGISPLGQKRALPTIVDVRAVDLPAIYVSAGRRGLQVELSPHDLVRLTRATVAAIARDS
ncbi:MAG TPA: Cys-tRNA(Pro) deacylase [Actinopolymorphaceae bacterium]